MGANNEAEQQLRAEVAGLAVDEILALCYAMHQNQQPHRLRFYLDVLRHKSGERAQFASCLICFDLARQGDPTAQREFAFLADTIRTLAAKQELVEALIARDPYLIYVWDLCQAQLAELDPRFADGGSSTVADTPAVGALDLLSDDDFEEELPDLAADVDTSTLWLRFDEAVEAFLGGQMGVPVYDPSAGFHLRNGRDVERIEVFLRELESLRELVSLARGFRALVLLFYGTHIRSKSIFGSVNRRKQELLRAGIEEFLASGSTTWEIAGVLGSVHAEPDVWEKIADVLSDYLRWMAEDPAAALAGPSGYDAVGRMLARDVTRSARRG